MKFTFVPEASPLEGYTIKRAIHRGGFGEVYYALSDSGKEVALKLLNNNLEVELRGVRQCLNLKHPNLVTIFDIREDHDGDHWIVMEFIGGRGLYEEMQRYPDGMPLSETLHWLSGIAAGLSFLHDRGIVHRDLKPANVFSDQGIVKVGDVGLSKYISESRRSAQTQSVGTVYYMAPEVCHGRYGREVDVYALGIMLVEMLTGQVPFDGETTAEILMKHMTAEPDLTPVPEALRGVVAAALEKDPEQRIQDVEELERRFRAAIDGVSDEEFQLEVAPAQATSATPQIDRLRAPTTVSGDTPAAGGTTEQAADSAAAATESSVAAAELGWTDRVTQVWNGLPVPVRWAIGGVAALVLLESGAMGLMTSGAFLGISVYLGYLLVDHFWGDRTVPAAPDIKSGKAAEASLVGETRQTHDLPPDVKQPADIQPVVPVAVEQRRPRTRRHRKHHRPVCLTPATPRQLGLRQRVSDLSNSMTMAIAATFLVTLSVYLTTSLLREPVHAVYFGTVTLLGAWILLIPAKLKEGRPGDALLRRLLFAGLGLAVGFVAWGLQEYLLLAPQDLFVDGRTGRQEWTVGRIVLADGSGYPTMGLFMLFFGLLFAFRRWWWQADSFRRARFRVSSTLITLVVGAVVAGMLEFPGALGATWALALSAVVQLSAGWTPHPERLRQQSPEAAETPVGQAVAADLM